MRALRRVAIGFFLYVAASVAAAFAVRALVPEFGGEGDEVFSVVSSMSGREFRSSSDRLRSGNVTAFMGGAEIDLRHASIVDGARLSLRAFMGGIDILVPDAWRVEVTESVFLGGIVNRTAPDSVADDAPLLVIDAVITMGGVEIHGSREV
jgi:hypothetical protein